MSNRYEDDLIIAVREAKKHMTVRELVEKYNLKRHQVTYILYHESCKLTDDKPMPVDYVVEDAAFEDPEDFEKDELSIVNGFKKTFKGLFEK
jgi:hypothetical protein|tara:strand:+ start:2058 stop:2333 length:276 start_codon:yes stop_codon:yes gene_type:complete